MKYKFSRYLQTIELNTSVFVFSLVTKALYQLNPKIALLMKQNRAISKDEIAQEELSLLIEDKILIEEETNEYKLLELAHNSIIYNTKFLSLGIYPTMSCNLSCHYCFEQYKGYTI